MRGKCALARATTIKEALTMGLPGPSNPVRVEPLQLPEPAREPAPPAQEPAPAKKPVADPVPA